jgi:hypothetical protein
LLSAWYPRLPQWRVQPSALTSGNVGLNDGDVYRASYCTKKLWLQLVPVVDFEEDKIIIDAIDGVWIWL